MNLNITYGTCSTPYGPQTSTRTLDQAGSAAIRSVSRRQRGLETECPRKLGRVTPQRCAALYRIGMSPCVSTLMGRCSLGMIEDQRQPKAKEDNMGKSNYGTCVLCGHTANRDSEGRCYRPACKEARKPAAEPFEKIEELPGAVGATLDPSKPFSLAGFEVDPKVFAKPLSPATVHISKSGNLHISRGAFVAFDLGRFVAVSMVPSRDKRALALVFSTTDIKGYRHLTPDHSSTCNPKASAREVIRVWPEVVGQKLLMRETLAAGAFVAVLDGEAAEVGA